MNITVTYPIATVTGGTQPDAASSFVAFVLSSAGQSVLHEGGFGPPPH